MVRLYPTFKAEKVLGVVASPYGTVIGAHGGGGSYFVGNQTIGFFQLPCAPSGTRKSVSDLDSQPRKDRSLKRGPLLYVAVAAVEAVHVWETRRARLVARLTNVSVLSPVTCISCTLDLGSLTKHADQDQRRSSGPQMVSSVRYMIAAGHADGTISLYVLQASEGQARSTWYDKAAYPFGQTQGDATQSEPSAASGGVDHAVFRLCDTKRLQGHRSGVTCLAFSGDSAHLACGCRNGDVSLWDIWSEQCILQLRGLHSDLVTSLCFIGNSEDNITFDAMQSTRRGNALYRGKVLLSSGKDAVIKLVDLETQDCLQALFCEQSAIWSTVYLAKRKLFLAGNNDGDIHLWRQNAAASGDAHAWRPPSHGTHFTKIGVVHRARARSRLLGLCAAPDDSFVIGFDADRNLEFYEVRDESGVKRHIKRRRKRAAKKHAMEHVSSANSCLEGESGDGDDAMRNELEASDFLCLRLQTKFECKILSLACITNGDRFGKDRMENLMFIVHRANNAVSVENACMILGDTQNEVSGEISLANVTNATRDTRLETSPVRVSGVECALYIGGDGHPQPVTALALSDDFDQFLSASMKSVPLPRVGHPLILSAAQDIRIWNSGTGQCLCSIELPDAGERKRPTVTAVMFLRPPSDAGASFVEGKYAAVATDKGAVMILDCESGVILEKQSIAPANGAPTGPVIRAMAQSASGNFIAVGGNAGFVSFHRLSFSGTTWSVHDAPRLEVANEITALCFTPNEELILVALTDMTVRAFRMDSLSFALSFYGHKLPVTTMDISGDSKMLVTGSMDKSIRLWGLQFGDCIRCISRAHEDGVTCVRFDYSNPRCFWSGGRDGSLRYWDADLAADRSFICTLDGKNVLAENGWGHRSGTVTSIAPSGRGEIVVSAGTDHSIRVWHRLDDQIVAGEEGERALREHFETDALKDQESDYIGIIEAEENESEAAYEPATSVGSIHNTPNSLKTLDSIAATDRIIEQMARFEDETRLDGSSAKKQRISELLPLLRSIRTTHYNAALTALPMGSALMLARICLETAEHPEDFIQCSLSDRELLIRTVLKLIKDRFREFCVHIAGPEGNQTRKFVSTFRQRAQAFLRDSRSIVGMNIAALRMI
jgi:WD40 repeat protein